ncbi:MAG: peptidoglycan editing factor PgeF [Nitrospirota bacterium]|nr:peptidoglycan editing factor PgeF [Nitrospirota bacterium]
MVTSSMASRHITVPAFAEAREGVRHFFGTRHEADRPGWASSVVVSVTQVHGTEALVLDRPVEPGETFSGGWDALVTNQREVLLTVKTADCVPVLVHDPRQGAVAAIHAGWRGTVAGILPRTLAVMQERFGSAPRSLRIGIGPSAGPCCYEVDEPVLTKLRERCPDWSLVVRETGPGAWLLDLRHLLRRQAQAMGMDDISIKTVNACTICHPTLFHSYRREGTARGTMVSGIMLTRRSKKR